jgi:cytochrome c oxidase cbb3-type subunit 3
MRAVVPVLLAGLMTALPAAAEEPQMPSAETLLSVPITGVMPGIAPPSAPIDNPFEGDKTAIQRGYEHFQSFNCVGCHAPNGAGGMGPSLSNSKWIYGAAPARIYLSIAQGRPSGMPAYGTMLPPETIWQLVAYVKSIAKPPGPTFGTVTSANPQRPEVEQVPAELQQTTTPWEYTQPFRNGQKP